MPQVKLGDTNTKIVVLPPSAFEARGYSANIHPEGYVYFTKSGHAAEEENDDRNSESTASGCEQPEENQSYGEDNMYHDQQVSWKTEGAEVSSEGTASIEETNVTQSSEMEITDSRYRSCLEVCEAQFHDNADSEDIEQTSVLVSDPDQFSRINENQIINEGYVNQSVPSVVYATNPIYQINDSEQAYQNSQNEYVIYNAVNCDDESYGTDNEGETEIITGYIEDNEARNYTLVPVQKGIQVKSNLLKKDSISMKKAEITELPTSVQKKYLDLYNEDSSRKDLPIMISKESGQQNDGDDNKYTRQTITFSFPSGNYKRKLHKSYAVAWAQDIKRDGFARCFITTCNFISLHVGDMQDHYRMCDGVPNYKINLCNSCNGRLLTAEELSLHAIDCKGFTRPENNQGSNTKTKRRYPTLNDTVSTRIKNKNWQRQLKELGYATCNNGQCNLIAFNMSQIESHQIYCKGVANYDSNCCDLCKNRFFSNNDLLTHRSKCFGEQKKGQTAVAPKKSHFLSTAKKDNLLHFKEISKLRECDEIDVERIVQPGPVFPDNIYIRRRGYTKQHKSIWTATLEKLKYVKCIFQNCYFLAMSLEDMISHFGYCNGDGSFAKHICPHCKGRVTSQTILEIHIQRSHRDIIKEEKPEEISEVSQKENKSSESEVIDPLSGLYVSKLNEVKAKFLQSKNNIRVKKFANNKESENILKPNKNSEKTKSDKSAEVKSPEKELGSIPKVIKTYQRSSSKKMTPVNKVLSPPRLITVVRKEPAVSSPQTESVSSQTQPVISSPRTELVISSPRTELVVSSSRMESVASSSPQIQPVVTSHQKEHTVSYSTRTEPPVSYSTETEPPVSYSTRTETVISSSPTKAVVNLSQSTDQQIEQNSIEPMMKNDFSNSKSSNHFDIPSVVLNRSNEMNSSDWTNNQNESSQYVIADVNVENQVQNRSPHECKKALSRIILKSDEIDYASYDKSIDCDCEMISEHNQNVYAENNGNRESANDTTNSFENDNLGTEEETNEEYNSGNDFNNQKLMYCELEESNEDREHLETRTEAEDERGEEENTSEMNITNEQTVAKDKWFEKALVESFVHSKAQKKEDAFIKLENVNEKITKKTCGKNTRWESEPIANVITTQDTAIATLDSEADGQPEKTCEESNKDEESPGKKTFRSKYSSIKITIDSAEDIQSFFGYDKKLTRSKRKAIQSLKKMMSKAKKVKVPAKPAKKSSAESKNVPNIQQPTTNSVMNNLETAIQYVQPLINSELEPEASQLEPETDFQEPELNIPSRVSKRKRQISSSEEDNLPLKVIKAEKLTLSVRSELELLPNAVKCSRCDLILKKNKFNEHNNKKHAGLSWCVGDEPLNLEDEKVVTSAVKKAFRSVKSATCENCKAVKKSALGFVSHLKTCGKSAEEVQAIKVTCEICSAKVLKYSLPMHMKLSHPDPPPENVAEKVVETLENASGKRKSAVRAATKFQEALNQGDEEPNNSKKSRYFFYERGVTKIQRLPSKITGLWYKMQKAGRKIPCRHINCTMESDNVRDAKLHHFLCSELPEKVFVCRYCDYHAAAENDVKSHVTFHRRNLDRDFEFDSNAEDEEIAEDEVEEIEGGVCEGDETDENKKTKRKKNKRTFQCAKPSAISEDAFIELNLRKDYAKRENLLPERGSKLFHHTLKLTLDNELEDLRTKVKDWPELKTELRDWQIVGDENLGLYLPNQRESISTCITKDAKVDVKWRKFKLFEADLIADSLVMFAGGKIRAISWCPISVKNMVGEEVRQYLAVSASQKMEKFENVFDCRSARGLIQIWDFGALEDWSPKETPKMALGIAHDFGEVWDLTWLPKDVSAKPEGRDLKRLGLLGAACQDGTVRILSICEPSQLVNNNELPIYKIHSSVILKLEEKPSSACLNLSMSKSGTIVAGFTDGFIGVWNLRNISSSFAKHDGKSRVLRPHLSFQAHRTLITSLSLSPKDDRYISTCGLDRTIKFWDLNYPFQPFESYYKEVCLDTIWPRNWPLTFSSFEDVMAGSTKGIIKSLRDSVFEGTRTALTANVAFPSFSFSDWLNALVGCNIVGEIRIRFFRNILLSEEKAAFRLENVISSVDVRKLKDETEEAANGFSGNDEEKSNKKDKTKRKELDEPKTYEEARSSYGIIIRDYGFDFSKKPIKLEDKNLSPERYPITSASKVRFNPNVKSCTYMAVGYHCGLVRILRLDQVQKDDHLKKFMKDLNNMIY